MVRIVGGAAVARLGLILAALAAGRSTIEGLAGHDVAATEAALRAMGARIGGDGDARIVDGVGNGCLLAPRLPLDLGRDGIGATLLLGLVASYDFTTVLAGVPASARGLPGPLAAIGAQVGPAPDGRVPVTVRGPRIALPGAWRIGGGSVVEAAALLLAALNAPGVTTVDLADAADGAALAALLAAFGAAASLDAAAGGGILRIDGQPRLDGCRIALDGAPARAAIRPA